jgi:hypothetical protein
LTPTPVAAMRPPSRSGSSTASPHVRDVDVTVEG